MGIDPGLTGAFAVIDDKHAYTSPIPTHWDVVAGVTKNGNPKYRRRYSEMEIRNYLRACKDAIVTLEKQSPRPHDGTTSGFSTAYGYGLFKGMLLGLFENPPFAPRPEMWQKEFFEHDKNKNTKEQSIEAAKQLFPKVSLLRSERARIPDHNLADALLLAEWCKRKVEGTLK